MKNLYISNLNETTNEKILRNYFEKFGPIYRIQLYTLPSGNCKGYAKIAIESEPIYNKILDTPLHQINGMRISVEPYIELDSEAFDKDIDVVSRRICVFGIPKDFGNTQFRKLFEKEYGKLDSAYVRVNEKKYFNYGFVTFNSKEQANAALERKRIYLDDEENDGRYLDLKEFIPKGISKKRENIVEENIGTNGERLLSYMPEEKMKSYLKAIVDNNPNIINLNRSQVEYLELFYQKNEDEYQKKKRGTAYNYVSIASRFVSKIERNEGLSNLRFNQSNFNMWSNERWEKVENLFSGVGGYYPKIDPAELNYPRVNQFDSEEFWNAFQMFSQIYLSGRMMGKF